MPAVASVREAEQYLIAQIVAEAQRDAIYLSPAEVKLLSFSELRETHETLSGMEEASRDFDRGYDRLAYEKKITRLAAHARTYARQQGTLKKWNEAVQLLSREDHYLLALLPRTVAESIGRTKLLLAALLFAAIFALLISLMLVRA